MFLKVLFTVSMSNVLPENSHGRMVVVREFSHEIRSAELWGAESICVILASDCPKELDKRKRKVRVVSCFMRRINS
jgi:hypothetical protein